MVEINGVKYKKKAVTKQQVKSATRMAYMLAVCGRAAIGAYMPENKLNLDEYDLIKEFGLIQNKRSNLSRHERDRVVKQFNRLYEKV